MSRYTTFLKTNLAKYLYSDLSFKDITDALTQYTDLRPTMELFTFNDGTQKNLVSLSGTIPVRYHGGLYNIPIAIFLMEQHPYTSPYVFVKPTSTMQIKTSKHVDSNGRIYLPYLSDWRYGTSDLIGLIGVMSLIFGEECPVFARNAAPPSSTPYGNPPPARPFQMPQPTNFPTPSSFGSTAPPPPPEPMKHKMPNLIKDMKRQAEKVVFGSQGYQMPVTSNGNTGGNAGQFGAAVGSGWGNNYPPYSQPQSNWGGGGQNYTQTVTESHMRMSLQSAVEDQVRRQLRDIHAQHTAELEVLRRTEEDLKKGSQNINEMLERIDRELKEVQRATTTIDEKNREMETQLTKLNRQESFNVDEAVDTTAPLYRQLFSAFCEEQGIEDAIYFLGEGLGKNVIDIELFLKKVRELSRKQFMLRATVQKCREKAGLPVV